MSRKLDALVAEKVMGCPFKALPERNQFGMCDHCGWSCVDDPHQRDRTEDSCGRLTDCNDDCRRRYSTDISAAWEVVEKFGDGVRIELRHNHHPIIGWCCVIVPDDCKTAQHCDYEKESAAMVICLAALRAVGVPESEIQEAMQ